MNDFFRALIAGWTAKKLGGGCLSTIIIFVVVYTLLGKCGNQTAHSAPLPPQVKALHVVHPVSKPAQVTKH